MLAAFNARHPGLYVSVTVGNSRDTLRDLLDYRTDVAVLAHVDPDPRLVAIPYRRHRVVVMCPVDHPFARRRSLRAARHGGPAADRARGRLDDAPRLRPGDARGRRAAQVVMEIGSRESIREAVAKGIGLGVVSEAEFIPDPRIRALPVTDAEIYHLRPCRASEGTAERAPGARLPRRCWAGCCRSVRHPAAVDHQVLAGDEGRLVGGEEEGGVGDVLRAAEARQRRAGVASSRSSAARSARPVLPVRILPGATALQMMLSRP